MNPALTYHFVSLGGTAGGEILTGMAAAGAKQVENRMTDRESARTTAGEPHTGTAVHANVGNLQWKQIEKKQ